MPRTPPRTHRPQPLTDLCGVQPTEEKKEEQQQKRPTGRFLLLLLIFFFFSVGWPRTETVRGVAGGPCRGVGAMDGAIELTWTYLQRPLHGPPATPNT
ncbi:hypothetical protein D5301_11450 [Stenotrophomonas sp. MH181796]|nr:hypothetical protein [Stenotrophomonas sp. MH181796]